MSLVIKGQMVKVKASIIKNGKGLQIMGSPRAKPHNRPHP